MAFCTECGTETVGMFCHECGTAVRVLCPKCSLQVPEGAKFCPQCGVRISKEAWRFEDTSMQPVAPAREAHASKESQRDFRLRKQLAKDSNDYPIVRDETLPSAVVTAGQTQPMAPRNKARFGVWWLLLAVFLTFTIYYVLENILFLIGASPSILGLRVLLIPMVGFVIFQSLWSKIRGEAT